MTGRFMTGRWLCPLLIIGLSGYLAFRGLADNYFWDDEAGTAIFARNLIDFGKLTAWDGRNLMAYRNGMELDDNFINRYVPPLQFVVAAAGFEFLGVSTLGGRFTFVVIGLLALIIFFFILRLESGGNRVLSCFGLSLLALSPSFLLYIRQCRYFSLGIFFPLFIYYFYKKYFGSRNPVHLALASAGFIGLFFSHFLICAAFAFALLGVHLKFHLRRRGIFPFLAAGIVFGGVVAGYILFSGLIFPVFVCRSGREWLVDRVLLFAMNFREINANGYFPWSMIAGIIWLELDRTFSGTLKKRAREWILLIVLYVICISLFSPQPVIEMGAADVRYLIPVLPFGMALLGVFVFFLSTNSRPAALVVMVLLIFTNSFSLNPWSPFRFRSYLINYLGEIHHDYTTPYEAAADFIGENCSQDDLVMVIPPNMSYPLQFYVGEKVIFGGRLDERTELLREKIIRLNPALLVDEARPDWIISFRWRALTEEVLTYFALRGIRYELQTALAVYYLGEMIRPELQLHFFRPITEFDPKTEGVLIFKRRKKIED